MFETYISAGINKHHAALDAEQEAKRIDAEIARYLDHRTLPIFVELILHYYEVVQQAERRATWHATDPKQAAKAEVKACWELWKAEPTRYKNRTKFAKDMLEKFPGLLESERVIAAKWVPTWEAEAEGIPPDDDD
ncbi:hypothetical protein [Variovorax rhizosphaerae]|uniref:Uncharacterized protein n=1 Tax=Variovorax rhizosphaerae TaxID=1836200 RepID=A0ABU8WHY3_9BURK